MSYDGRKRNIPWRNQNIKYRISLLSNLEAAEKGSKIFDKKYNKKPKIGHILTILIYQNESIQ